MEHYCSRSQLHVSSLGVATDAMRIAGSVCLAGHHIPSVATLPLLLLVSGPGWPTRIEWRRVECCDTPN